MLVMWRVAYFHAGRSQESLFPAVSSCGRDEKREPEEHRDPVDMVRSVLRRPHFPHSHCLTEQNSTRNSSPLEHLPSEQHAQSHQQPQRMEGPNVPVV